MRFRHVAAVCQKQWMDVGTRKSIVFQFLFYPLVILLFSLPSDRGDTVKIAMVSALSPMFIGSSPMLTVNAVIREDKSSGALRALTLAALRPAEYMTGVGVFIVAVSVLSSTLIGWIGGLAVGSLLVFVAVMTLGSILTTLMGCAFSLRSENPTGATVFISVFSVLNGMVPLLETLYPSVYTVTQFWYTQQIKRVIPLLYEGVTGEIWYSLAVIGANLLLLLAALCISCRKSRLFET